MLTGEDTGYKIEEWFAPQADRTQCSYLKIGRNYVITASGGVQIESWEVASKQEVRPEVSRSPRQGDSDFRRVLVVELKPLILRS